jgi:hypothetical protein
LPRVDFDTLVRESMAPVLASPLTPETLHRIDGAALDGSRPAPWS